MANLAGTYSSSRSYYPYLDYTIAASEVGRTATSVTYRFSCSVSIASSGGYGYDIILNYNVGGVTGTKTIKTTSGGFPSSTGNFDVVVSGQSASGGTNAVSVTMWSTSSTDSTHWQNAFNTGTKYLDRSNFNTAPSMSSVTISGVTNGAKVWENTSSVTVVCVASDSDGNLSAFQIERYVNDALNATYDVTTGWTKSGNTYTLNYSNSGINSLAQGAKVHYRVRAKDSYGEWSGYTTSGYFNLNKLTGATLTSSDTSITWSDTKVSFSYSGANNTNGDGTFTYQFWNNAGLTMYNNGAVASYSANQIDITTWGTTDAGRPYFDVTELKNFVKDIGDRTRSFTLYLRTFNSAGSYIDSAVTIIVSLKPVPTTPGTPTLAGTITASGASRYVPNVGGTYTLTWTASTDQTGGTGLTYEIEANFNNTGWYTVKSNLTALTYDISADVKRYTLSAATNYQARVVAHTEYVTEATSTARSITLDYWYAPDITIGKVTRANTSYSVPITAKVNSSFAVISSASWSGNSASGNLTITSGTASGTASQTIAASTSFTLTATVTDNSGLTGATQTDTQAISKYQPIISMRSLGLGVNAFADSTYIFKVGGKAMFGSAIGMTNSDDTFPRIVLQAYTGDTNGMGLALQSGGMMFVGAGESATALATQWETDGGSYTTEHLFLGADSGIYLASNCGTIANRKVGLYTTGGNFHIPGAYYESSDAGTGGTTSTRVYSPNNKPTPAAIGAMPTSGGTFTGDVITAKLIVGGTSYMVGNATSLDSYAINNSPHFEASAGNFTVYSGTPGSGSNVFRCVSNRVTSFHDFETDRLRGRTLGYRTYLGDGGNSRIDATSDCYARLYTALWSDGAADTGSYWSPYGGMAIKVKGVNKHDLQASGTKVGGSIELDGITYGMSPTDSPRSLIEDIFFDKEINGETRIEINEILSRSLDKYAIFASNNKVEIVEKGKGYFIVKSEVSCISDFRLVGTRIDVKDQYYHLMGGITNGDETVVSY